MKNILKIVKFVCIFMQLAMLLLKPVKSNAQFTTLSGEKLVNTTTIGNQEAYWWSVRTTAVQPDGGFIQAFIDKHGLDGQSDGVYAQRFNAAGEKLGTQFLVNTTVSGQQFSPSMDVAPNGSFIIAWEGPGTSTDVFAQQYTKDGVKIGSEFLLSTTVKGNQTFPEIQFYDDGSFIAGFVDGGHTVLQRFSADCRPIGLETRVSSASGDVTIDGLCVRSDGTVLLTWSSGGDVYGQFFSSTLQPMGSQTRINTYLTGIQKYAIPRVDAYDNFVVVWESAGQDGSGAGVYGRRFDKNFNPLSAEFVLTSNTVGDQLEPGVAVGPGGRFIVIWTDKNNRDGGGGTGESVWLREFTANGTAVGSEVMINQSVTGYQSYPVIDMNASGRFVIAWEGNGTQTGQIDDFGVFARIYQLSQTGNTQITASISSATASDYVTITMTLTAPTSQANVSPNTLSLNGTNGVYATLVSGPSPVSATVGSSPVSFTWTYRITSSFSGGVLTFRGNAKNNTGAIFPYAESGQIVVKSSFLINDITGPNLVNDSNSPNGPKVFTIGAKIFNPSLHELTNVVAYLGDGVTAGTFPVTNMALSQTNNTYQGNFSLVPLGGTDDCMRVLDKLGPSKQLISGAIDFDGNGIINSLDKGTLSNGKTVVNGRVDVNKDGTATATDDLALPPGTFSGYREPAIIDGYVDANNDGVINASDNITYGGETEIVYWQVKYQVVDNAGKPTFGDCNNMADDLRYDWIIWGSAQELGVNRVEKVSDYARVRCMQSASTNKIAPQGSFFSSGPARIIAGGVDVNLNGSISTADDGTFYGKTVIDGKLDMDGNGVVNTADDGVLIEFKVIDGSVDANNDGVINAQDDGIIIQPDQTFSLTVNNVTFGTIGQGFDENRDGLWDYDFWYQPIGEPTWPAANFRLVDIQSSIVGLGGSNPYNGVTLKYNNEPYLSRLFDDRLNQGGTFNGTYTFTFKVIRPSNGFISPYQEASSGANNIKYNADYGIGMKVFTSPMSVLPVRGLEITSSLQQTTAIIKWKTDAEENTSHYLVERSTDGKQFSTIHRQQAAGNSSTVTNYTYTDNMEGVVAEKQVFYRIKQVDGTGKFSFSKTSVLMLPAFNGIKVGPNPFKDKISVALYSKEAGAVSLSLMDVNGRMVRPENKQLVIGTNQIQITNLGNLPSGIYNLRISGKEGIQNIKLVKGE